MTPLRVAKMREFAVILDKRSKAFAQVANDTRSSLKALNDAIKAEEESKHPLNSEVSADDFELIVDTAIRLSELQRT